jgi:hypothetical protein
MGVGELSAINGVAGAYTESVKLIHIVGTTGTRAQKARAMIHHCLGVDPDHRVRHSENHVGWDDMLMLDRSMRRYPSLCVLRIVGLMMRGRRRGRLMYYFPDPS